MAMDEPNGPTNAPAADDAKAFAERIAQVTSTFPSQRKAAMAAGISTTAFQHWLSGERNPGVLNVSRFAKAAGVSMDWLMYGIEPRELRSSDERRLSALVEATREAYAQAGVTAVAKPEMVRTAIAAAVDHNVRKPGLGWKIADQVLDLLAQYDAEEAEKARNRTKHLRDVD